MLRPLFALLVVVSVIGCTSTEAVRSADTRVTGAQVAAHCMNGVAEDSHVTSANWKKNFNKHCGKGAHKYLGTPQFQESLSLKAHDLIMVPALAE